MKQYTKHLILGQLARKSIEGQSCLFEFPWKAVYVTGQMHLVTQGLQFVVFRGRDPTLGTCLADICISARPPNKFRSIIADSGETQNKDANNQGNLVGIPTAWDNTLQRLLHKLQCNPHRKSMLQQIEPCHHGLGSVWICLLWNGMLPRRRRERMARDGIILIAGRFKARLSGSVTHLFRGNKVLCENCFTKQKPNHVNPVLLWLRERYALKTSSLTLLRHTFDENYPI